MPSRRLPLLIAVAIMVALLGGVLRALTFDPMTELAAEQVGGAQFVVPARSAAATITKQAALDSIDKTLRTYGPAKGKPYVSDLRTYKQLNGGSDARLVWLFVWHARAGARCDFVIAIDATTAKAARVTQDCARATSTLP